MRLSGTSRSSFEGGEPRFWLLDALVDAPSSFAAALFFIRQMWGEPAQRLSVDVQLDVVRAAASDGLIELRVHDEAGGLFPVSEEQWRKAADEYRRWLSDLVKVTQDDVVYDPVGLWIAITAEGRKYWSALTSGDADEPRRRADYDAATGRVVAWAESVELARRAAVELAHNLRLEMDASSESVSLETSAEVRVSYGATPRAQT